jgi:histone RNA hairpin-binding protein
MKSTGTAKLPIRKSSNNVKKQASTKAVFSRLDPAQHARRIDQRRKTIAFGKNTAGYYEYIHQVPKEKRHQKSMKHPATPDPTLDIPTKRWQGMIKAW